MDLIQARGRIESTAEKDVFQGAVLSHERKESPESGLLGSAIRKNSLGQRKGMCLGYSKAFPGGATGPPRLSVSKC